MKTVIHKSNSRGQADHGWLKAKHSFSFANYYDPDKVSFGVLRVLNDDTIAAGAGFPKHPHDNMEIITIPLSGAIEHKDSMGNSSVINTGEIQVMSAGKGIFHSEFNHYKDQELKLFQIWIFPNIKNIEPRYDQLNISDLEKENELFQILSPSSKDQGLWIHQNTWFSMGNFTEEKNITYTLKDPTNGIYIMLIYGEISVADQLINTRDAIGIWDTNEISIHIKGASKLLLMEIPLDNKLK